MNPPSRVGYYIGALVAQRMAKRHSLVELARMPAAGVRKELGARLAEIGSGLEGTTGSSRFEAHLFSERDRCFIGSRQEFKDKAILK